VIPDPASSALPGFQGGRKAKGLLWSAQEVLEPMHGPAPRRGRFWTFRMSINRVNLPVLTWTNRPMNRAALVFELENDLWWKTEVHLPTWEACGKPVLAKISRLLPRKSTKLVFAPEGREAEPLSQEERMLVQWFLEHEPAVVDSLLEAILQEYPSMQEEYDYTDEEKAEYMPDIRSREELRKLLKLETVYVHVVQKEGIPYLGFKLGCTWDEEHELGVLMHGTRVVKVGGGDTAFLLWPARRDAAQSS